LTNHVVDGFGDVAVWRRGRDSRRERGNGRNGAGAKETSISKQGIVSGDSASGGGDGVIALADIAIGGARVEAIDLGMKGLHVGHGLFDTKR